MIENIEGKALHQFEEKLYFIESLIDYFTFQHVKTFEKIILQFVDGASKEQVL
jgi:regulator of sigma D